MESKSLTLAAGAVLVFATTFTLLDAQAAKEGPGAPCGPHVYPAYTSMTPPPNVEIWSPKDIPSHWEYPPCANWAPHALTKLVAVAGSFRLTGGADELLERMGAISGLRGIVYWSVTDRRLEPLITEAYAVDAKITDRPRSNYTAQEMRTGKDLFFVERDNRSSGRTLYRMRVIQALPDKLIVEWDNVSSIRFLLFTVFAPGELHSTFFFTHLGSDEWGYYSLSRANETKAAALVGHEQSYINRLIALYGHTVQTPDLAGMSWAK